jgi:HSP20 family protein
VVILVEREEVDTMFELLRTFTNDRDFDRHLGPFADVARSALLPPLAVPAADVLETADALRVVLDLPGVLEEGISVGFENDVLTIEAERKIDGAQGEAFLVSERGSGKLRRSFTVNVGVDADRIEAAYERGVLTVTLPKRADAKPRKIGVKVK